LKPSGGNVGSNGSVYFAAGLIKAFERRIELANPFAHAVSIGDLVALLFHAVLWSPHACLKLILQQLHSIETSNGPALEYPHITIDTSPPQKGHGNKPSLERSETAASLTTSFPSGEMSIGLPSSVVAKHALSACRASAPEQPDEPDESQSHPSLETNSLQHSLQ